MITNLSFSKNYLCNDNTYKKVLFRIMNPIFLNFSNVIYQIKLDFYHETYYFKFKGDIDNFNRIIESATQVFVTIYNYDENFRKSYQALGSDYTVIARNMNLSRINNSEIGNYPCGKQFEEMENKYIYSKNNRFPSRSISWGTIEPINRYDFMKELYKSVQFS